MERIEEARKDYPEIIEELERLKRVVDQIFELTDMRIVASSPYENSYPVYSWADAWYDGYPEFKVSPKYQDLNEELERR